MQNPAHVSPKSSELGLRIETSPLFSSRAHRCRLTPLLLGSLDPLDGGPGAIGDQTQLAQWTDENVPKVLA